MKVKKEKIKEQTIQDMPKLTGEYLTKNNLWDSQWLEKRHPETYEARRELNKILKKNKAIKLKHKINAKNKS